jgi:hypothetical protein
MAQCTVKLHDLLHLKEVSLVFAELKVQPNSQLIVDV